MAKDAPDDLSEGGLKVTTIKKQNRNVNGDQKMEGRK